MKNLSNLTKVTRVLNSVSAGTSDQNSGSVDMRSLSSVMFIAAFGTLTAGQVTNLKAQGSDDNSAWSDLVGCTTTPMSDVDDNQVVVMDLDHVKKRYVRVVVERGTANAAIDGITAVQYGAKLASMAHDAATVQEAKLFVEPNVA